MGNIIDVRWPAEVFQYVALGDMARHKEPKIGESVIASIEGRKYCVPIHAVPDYWTLVTLVSRLAAVNTQYQFYFRGQTNCYVEKGVHSIPPSLWRKRDQYEHKAKGGAERPSGNVPTARVLRLISRLSRSLALLVRIRVQCCSGKWVYVSVSRKLSRRSVWRWEKIFPIALMPQSFPSCFRL